MQACDRCHSRKTRCDRRIPQCSTCEKAGAACLHVDKLRQRNVPRGYMDSMEVQVQKLSEENRKLRGELASLRSQPDVNPGPQDERSVGSKNNESNESNKSNRSNMSAAANAEQTSPSPQEHTHSLSSSSPSTTVTGNVITEVEYLTLKATGETRYLGPSSGLGLASIIDSVVDSEKSLTLSPMDRKAPDMQSAHVIPSSPLDATFPPLTTAMSYIDAYFQHTHITFPIIHRPSFLRTVELIYNQSGYYENRPYDSYVFNMVLAIGSSNFNRFEEATSGPAAHYARAQAGLKAVLGMPGLMPLRAIILLSQHGIFSNLRDTSASIYHVVGMGARICFELGLHSDSKYIHGQKKPALHGVRRISFDEEMRRRCFWCLYNLDRVVSFTLGRPAALRDEDINVSLPSHLDDEDFGPDKPIVEECDVENNSDAQISPFLHLIRIRRLSGEIMSQFYSINPKENISLQEKILKRTKLHEELVSWRNDVQFLKLKERLTDERAHVSCFLTPEWYTAVFNNAMLLLYRPSPCLPQPSTPMGIDDEGDHLKLFLAAKATILAYADLHRKRRLNYSWITLHGVFVAGLTYVYGLGRALKDCGHPVSSLDLVEIINDTRACSNVLVAISERWNMSHRSCELFDQLSTAVIRDVVHLTSNHRTDSNERPANHPQVRGNTAVNGTASRETLSAQHFDSSIDTEMLGHELLPGHVSVIDEFRHYSTAFDSVFVGYEPYSSEVATGFSEDWMFEESFMDQGENGAQLQGSNPLW